MDVFAPDEYVELKCPSLVLKCVLNILDSGLDVLSLEWYPHSGELGEVDGTPGLVLESVDG